MLSAETTTFLAKMINTHIPAQVSVARFCLEIADSMRKEKSRDVLNRIGYELENMIKTIELVLGEISVFEKAIDIDTMSVEELIDLNKKLSEKLIRVYKETIA